MVMLQFKVIMRNPNKSKFSMVAERGLCIPRMFKEKSMVLFFYIRLSDGHQAVERKICSQAWAVRSPVSTLRCLTRSCLPMRHS